MDDVVTDEVITSLDELRENRMFVGCLIRGVAAESAELNGVHMTECRFVDCHLRNVKLTEATLTDTAFLRCNLVGVDFTKASWPQFGLSGQLAFVDCALELTAFFGIALTDSTFIGSSLREADLGAANLEGADLRWSDLTGANLHEATLDGADLTGALGYDVDPAATSVKGVRISLPEGGRLLERLGLIIKVEEDKPDYEAFFESSIGFPPEA